LRTVKIGEEGVPFQIFERNETKVSFPRAFLSNCCRNSWKS